MRKSAAMKQPSSYGWPCNPLTHATAGRICRSSGVKARPCACTKSVMQRELHGVLSADALGSCATDRASRSAAGVGRVHAHAPMMLSCGAHLCLERALCASGVHWCNVGVRARALHWGIGARQHLTLYIWPPVPPTPTAHACAARSARCPVPAASHLKTHFARLQGLPTRPSSIRAVSSGQSKVSVGGRVRRGTAGRPPSDRAARASKGRSSSERRAASQT